MYETSCQSRFDARYWMLGASALRRPRGMVCGVRREEGSETAAHQAPPSLGFFRQEHWSVLPFPSPMHESEKIK